MAHRHWKYILVATGAAMLSAVICIISYQGAKTFSAPTAQAFIESRLGEHSVQHVIVLTELTDEYDLIFYNTSPDSIAANILIKDLRGNYIDLITTTRIESTHVNFITGSTRNSKLPGHTLYWGIALSPEWRINHKEARQITVDSLSLSYYFHNAELDDEMLDLYFVNQGY